MQEMEEKQVLSLGWEDPPEEGMATHSSVLALENPMDSGAWRAMELQRIGQDWETNTQKSKTVLIQKDVVRNK